MNALPKTANPITLVFKAETSHRLETHVLKLRTKRGLGWLCLLMLGMFLPDKAAAQALSGNPLPPFFYDWGCRTPQQSGTAWPAGTVYLPHPGHDYPANHAYNLATWNNQLTNGQPVSFLLDSDCAPIGGAPDTSGERGVNTLSGVLKVIPALNICMADFEAGAVSGGVTNVRASILNMVSQIRNSTNPSIANAWIGNYAYYPGTDSSDFYHTSGLNIAQPNCYQYSSFDQNVGTGKCPNVRAARFWGPLEKFSGAARNLPTGHLLIPWVGEVVNTDPSPAIDRGALVSHLRLRGADSFAHLSTLSGQASTDDLNIDYSGWTSLDSWFDYQPVTYLTEDTSETTGLQWSGIRSENALLVYVSNLGNSARAADLTGAKANGSWFNGLPDATAPVPTSTHKFFVYYISNLFTNGGFDANAGGWYLTSAQRLATYGIGNTGCLQLQGGEYAALSTQNLATEPGATMFVKVQAKGQGGSPTLRIGYYYRDANGNALGNATALPNTAVGSTYGTYYATFTVPANPAITSISPILYNANYNSDSTNIVWVDNLTAIFATDSLLNNDGLDSDASGWYFTGTTIWSAIAGVNGTGCLQLQGGQYAAMSTQNVPTGPGATMTISVDAKGQGANPALRIGYYYRDVNGNALGNSTALATTAVTSNYATYSSDFTVPTNPAIASISVILYDANYPSDASDILWVDNIKLSFK